MIIKTNFHCRQYVLPDFFEATLDLSVIHRRSRAFRRNVFLENCYHSAVVDKKQALSDPWFLTQAIKIQEEQSCLSYKTSQSADVFNSATIRSCSAKVDFSQADNASERDLRTTVPLDKDWEDSRNMASKPQCPFP